MMKKIIAWLLVVVLTAGIAVGGTLAYLTDRDSEANVFTVGDVNIDLNEDFEQGSTLIPGVVIEKKPTVTNVGPNKAWVWTTVAVPEKLAPVIAFGDKGAGWEPWDQGIPTTINGENYVLYTILHTDALEVGEETAPVFSNVTLNSAVDIDPNGNWYTVVDGKTTSLGWNDADGEPVIYVSAYAIQTEGFASVADAYAAYYGQWGDNGTEYADPVNVLDTHGELQDAVGNSGNYVVAEDIDMTSSAMANSGDIDSRINLNGYKINVSPNLEDQNKSGLAFIVQKGANLEISGTGVVDMNYSESEKPKYCSPFFVSSKSTVTVNGGEYLMGACDQLYHIYSQNSSTIVINGGTYITSNPNAVIAYCINSYIEINGGFFQNTANPDQFLVSMGNNNKYFNNQKITISGGTFVNWNPMTHPCASAASDHPVMIFLAEGCEVVSETQANGDIWYTVVKS